MKRAILVPLDGTLLAEHAIPVAVSVARCTGAELHPVLVHLTDYFRDLGLTDASIPEMDRELTIREADYLTSIAERIAGQEVSVQAPVVLHGDVPDALARAWSALRTSTAGEVLASARPGYEFLDWGGAHHVGGGSHGSLHANDSLGSLLWCGTGPDSAAARDQWALRDVVPMITDHFQV